MTGVAMPPQDCKANKGNLLQHWVLCEALEALRGVTQTRGGGEPLLLYLDAHSMRPFSSFVREDETFRRVRQARPGQGSLYEAVWSDLVGGEKQYPSSAAFVDRIWNRRTAYLLCDQDEERASDIARWLARLDHEGRVTACEIWPGDWRIRFGLDRPYPLTLADLKRSRDDVPATINPDAAFVSFDPNQISLAWGGNARDVKSADFNLYVREIPRVWAALQPLSHLPACLQLSTYDTARGKHDQARVEEAVAETCPAGWRGPAVIRISQGMQSFVFWSDATIDIGLERLPARFDDWVAGIDRTARKATTRSRVLLTLPSAHI